jgi:hypothetical protein
MKFIKVDLTEKTVNIENGTMDRPVPDIDSADRKECQPDERR